MSPLGGLLRVVGRTCGPIAGAGDPHNIVGADNVATVGGAF